MHDDDQNMFQLSGEVDTDDSLSAYLEVNHQQEE